MIQLYKRENTNFKANGDYILHPTNCTLEQKLNDIWQLTLEYQFNNSEEFKEIVNEAVLAVPTPDSKKQLFRIYNTDKDDEGITAIARPIFLDAASDTMLIDIRPTDKTGQQALDIMTNGTKYKAESDILDINTAYYIRKNLVEAIASEDENSFLKRWGGEILYDNNKILINKRIGADRGVQAVFGRNLKAIEETIDMDGVVTRIVPVAYNGYTLEGSTPWIDSPIINNYAVVRTKVIEYTDIKLKEDCQEDEEGYSDLTKLRQALIECCNKEFEAGIDKPTANYKVDMIDLSQTDEYKNYKILEKVQLGDTIHCRNLKLNIETDARVIGITWDCINERCDTVELGGFIPNYLMDMSRAIQSIVNNFDSTGNVKGESIAGVIDLMKTKIKASREIAKRQVERAILFEDKDTNSPTYGAMSLGTTGFAIADSMDMHGDWIWNTFGTGAGFLADYIIAGVLYSQNYVENKQGIKIDLNQGLIKAFNLAWEAQNSSMSSDGTLLTKNIKVNGGNININDMFKVTSAGKLSWNTLKSNMTEEGELTCYSLNMLGGHINIKTDSASVSVINLTYGDKKIDIRPSGISITTNKYETVLGEGLVNIFNTQTKAITGIEAGRIYLTDSMGNSKTITAASS